MAHEQNQLTAGRVGADTGRATEQQRLDCLPHPFGGGYGCRERPRQPSTQGAVCDRPPGKQWFVVQSRRAGQCLRDLAGQAPIDPWALEHGRAPSAYSGGAELSWIGAAPTRSRLASPADLTSAANVAGNARHDHADKGTTASLQLSASIVRVPWAAPRPPPEQPFGNR